MAVKTIKLDYTKIFDTYTGSYGSEATTDNKNNEKLYAATGTYPYQSFLRVDISSIPTDALITNVKLFLWLEEANNVTLQVRNVLSDTWSFVTWSNKPSMSNPSVTQTVTTYIDNNFTGAKWVEYDIKSIWDANKVQNGDKSLLSLGLNATQSSSRLSSANHPTVSQRPYLEVTYDDNTAPTVTLSTTDAQTLYENDIYAINGNATDADSGNVLSVKYAINGGTARAILANVSTGTAMAYAKNLTYKSGMLYDGATAITGALSEGSQHTLKVWAEDDKGGKSSEIIRSFYVVPNRAATLTLDVFVTRTGLINTDVVNISGKVADLDNGNVIVKYKIGNGAFVQVFNNTVGATPTPFNFNVLLSDLTEGDNQITIQAVDAYNAITQHVLTIRKNKNEVPMLEAVTYYEVTPPNGTSDGLQLYIEREVGDLVVAVDVFMGAPGQSEVFVPMKLDRTANLTNGNAEDTFSYEHGADASKIVVRIKMTRSSGASNKAIKKISGVLT